MLPQTRDDLLANMTLLKELKAEILSHARASFSHPHTPTPPVYDVLIGSATMNDNVTGFRATLIVYEDEQMSRLCQLAPDVESVYAAPEDAMVGLLDFLQKKWGGKLEW